ncbi:MAG: phage major capsid protein, partial [Cyclobacteriaceae bacterium]
MSDYNIATKKLEELAQSIHDARQVADTEYKKSFEQLTNKSADLLTEINAIKDEKEKQDKLIKELELKMEHSNIKEDKVIDTKFAKDYYNRCNNFLRSSKAKSIGDIEFFNKAIDYVDAKEKNYFPTNSKIDDRFKKAVIEGNDVQGGFWILPEWYSQDVTRYYESNPLPQLATTATTGSYELNTIIDDNLSTFGGWVGETQPRNQTDTAQIGELSIPIHEVFAQPAASQRMIEDADFDLVGWISNKTQQIFMLQENSAFMTGDGAKKPRGILDYPAWDGSAVTTYDQSSYERGALQYIKSGSDGEVTYDGLINLQTSLLEPYQPN